jgi:hypothetical protein
MGLIGKQYTSVALTAADIADDAVTSGKIADGTIVDADINASAAIAASKVLVDTSAIEDDVALLGFKVAVAGSMAKYNLVDQTEDAFMDATGVDASASTNESRNAANYYSGETSTTAVTGGTITTDGSYKVHTFLADGTLTTYASGDVDYLVVGGGGSGGGSLGTGWPGAGGGAGGFRTATGLATTAQAYAITVGDGATANGTVAAESSIFSTITSTGGGYGGKGNYGASTAGGAGGSGGGGGQGTGVVVGGAASPVTSPVQGYAGVNSWLYGAGGGGGAGALGSSGTGGVGVASSYSGASVTYSTGGNGSSGSGGAANTGNGGAGTTSSGTAGGSGIVIIRYLTGAFNVVGDMTLQSNATTANDGAPTKGDIVMTYTNGAGTATLNTDLTAEFSADNGSTWTSTTLVAQGSTGTHLIVSAHDVTRTSTSGTAMKYRIKTLNQSASKETRVQAVSLGWS